MHTHRSYRSDIKTFSLDIHTYIHTYIHTHSHAYKSHLQFMRTKHTYLLTYIQIIQQAMAEPHVVDEHIFTHLETGNTRDLILFATSAEMC